MRFLLSLVSLCFISVAYADFDCKTPNHCQVVMDVGSTGTRAYLYQYQQNEEKQLTSVNLLTKKTKSGGLASVKESAVDEYMSDLLLPILDEINDKTAIKLSILGTAGMRLLSDDLQTNLYQVAKDFGQMHGFKVMAARTISGQEEGVYAWLGVNAPSILNHSPKKDFSSIIDIGGASTQIAYLIPLDKKPLSGRNIIIQDKKYFIYSQSFLGLGVNEAMHQLMDNNNCFAKGYPLSGKKTGNGNWQACQKSIEVLIDVVHGVKVKAPKSQWVALGALPFLAKSLDTHLGDSFLLSKLLEQGRSDFCQTTWSSIKARLPNDVKYTFGYCFQSNYLAALLQGAYGMDRQTMIKTEGGDNGYGWTAGALIDEYTA